MYIRDAGEALAKFLGISIDMIGYGSNAKESYLIVIYTNRIENTKIPTEFMGFRVDSYSEFPLFI